LSGNLNGRVHLEDLDVDRKKSESYEKGGDGADWIHVLIVGTGGWLL
jgi:hypothetical protein